MAQKIIKQKNFKEENLKKDTEKEVEMAYYCKRCGAYHYPYTNLWYAHKIYASQRHRPKKVVKRRKRTFWDEFFS